MWSSCASVGRSHGWYHNIKDRGVVGEGDPIMCAMDLLAPPVVSEAETRAETDDIMFMGFFPVVEEGTVTNGTLSDELLPYETLRRYFIPELAH